MRKTVFAIALLVGAAAAEAPQAAAKAAIHAIDAVTAGNEAAAAAPETCSTRATGSAVGATQEVNARDGVLRNVASHTAPFDAAIVVSHATATLARISPASDRGIRAQGDGRQVHDALVENAPPMPAPPD